jgi:hypothetical protein
MLVDFVKLYDKFSFDKEPCSKAAHASSSTRKVVYVFNHKNLHRVHMRNQAEIFPIIIAFPMFKEAHAWPEISDIAAHEHNILCQQVPVRHA